MLAWLLWLMAFNFATRLFKNPPPIILIENRSIIAPGFLTFGFVVFA